MQPQVILITGASSGFGKITAQMLSERGHIVYGTSRKPSEDMNHVKMLVVDVTNFLSVCRAVERILSEQGRIDVLINNAGRTFNVEFEDISEKSIKRDLEINLISTMLCSKYAVDLMKDQGWIVNTASIRGMENGGRPGILGYCAAKAGVINFTKSLAVHLAPRVCVNAVAPGFVNTEYIVEHMSEELRYSWLSQIPMKSFVNIHELAKVYLNLVTNRSMTGIVIPVDGGYTLLNR